MEDVKASGKQLAGFQSDTRAIGVQSFGAATTAKGVVVTPIPSSNHFVRETAISIEIIGGDTHPDE